MDIKGSKKSDHLIGSDDMDRIFGKAGADTLIGKGGGDELVGGKGNDVLIAGAGNDYDVLEGGAGRDTFIISAEANFDGIRDFDPAKDTLILDVPGTPDQSLLEWGRPLNAGFLYYDGVKAGVLAGLPDIDTGDIILL